MLYLTTLETTRRIPGYRVRIVWPDRISSYVPAYIRTARRTYRTLRRSGYDRLEARWAIFDLITAGRYTEQDNDREHVGAGSC